jgi:hypothetical protein
MTMTARRAVLRAILLGLVPGLLLASCKSAQDGDYSRQRQPRDGGSGDY